MGRAERLEQPSACSKIPKGTFVDRPLSMVQPIHLQNLGYTRQIGAIIL